MNLPDQLRLRQWMAQAAVIPMVCLSITVPAIVFTSSLPYFKIEQLLLPVVVLVYLWLLLIGVARPIRITGIFLVGLLFMLSNWASISYGANFLGQPINVRDYYELPKVWLPVAFFTIAFEAELSETGIRRLVNGLSYAAGFVCLYAWGQFFGVGISYRLNPYYSTGGHIDQELEYARRVYSTMGNANALGALMSWCVILFVLAALYGVGHRLRNSIMAFACLTTMVMTGSRYSFLTTAIGFLLVFALASSAGRRSLPKLALVLLMLPLVAWTYQTIGATNRRNLERYETLKDPLQVDSLRERLDILWPVAWSDISRSPYLGHGPGKSALYIGVAVVGTIDSEALTVIRDVGFLGFAVYLGFYLYPLYIIWKGQRAVRVVGEYLADHAPGTLMTLQASLILCVLALIMNIGMSTYSTPFLQGFLWLWLGIGVRSAFTTRALLEPRIVRNVPNVREVPFAPQNVPSV